MGRGTSARERGRRRRVHFGWEWGMDEAEASPRTQGFSTSLGRGRVGLRRSSPGFALQEAIDRLGRGRTLRAPVLEPNLVDREQARVLRRIVRPDVLEETTSAGAAVIGDHQAVERL